jgi:hypothetical protein
MSEGDVTGTIEAWIFKNFNRGGISHNTSVIELDETIGLQGRKKVLRGAVGACQGRVDLGVFTRLSMDFMA